MRKKSLSRFSLFLLLLSLLFPLQAFSANDVVTPNPVYEPAYTTTGTLAALNDSVSSRTFGYAGNTVEVSGTFVGTLTFYGINSDGSSFTINAYPVPSGNAATTTTTTGQWMIPAGSSYKIMVKCTAYTSGSATVTIQTGGVVLTYVASPTAANFNATVSGTVTANAGTGEFASNWNQVNGAALSITNPGFVKISDGTNPLFTSTNQGYTAPDLAAFNQYGNISLAGGTFNVPTHGAATEVVQVQGTWVGDLRVLAYNPNNSREDYLPIYPMGADGTVNATPTFDITADGTYYVPIGGVQNSDWDMISYTSGTATLNVTFGGPFPFPIKVASGTITANAGTNLNTSALALDATLTGGTLLAKPYDGTNVIGVTAHPFYNLVEDAASGNVLFALAHPGYVQFGSAQAVNATLQAGSALAGGVEVYDSAGTNKLSVDTHGSAAAELKDASGNAFATPTNPITDNLNPPTGGGSFAFASSNSDQTLTAHACVSVTLLNPSANTHTIYVNVGAAATTSTFPIAPGAAISFDTSSTGNIHVIASAGTDSLEVLYVSQ